MTDKCKAYLLAICVAGLFIAFNIITMHKKIAKIEYHLGLDIVPEEQSIRPGD